MPNWTHNTLIFNDKTIFENTLKKFVVNNEFDFNTIVPMPDLIRDTVLNNHTDKLLEFAKQFNDDISPEEIVEQYARNHNCDFSCEEARKLCNCLKCLKRYGVAHWLDWSCENWTTKWNAVDTHINRDELYISFDTAWSPPFNIFELMAKKQPDLKCRIESLCCGGAGYKVYIITIKKGIFEIYNYNDTGYIIDIGDTDGSADLVLIPKQETGSDSPLDNKVSSNQEPISSPSDLLAPF